MKKTSCDYCGRKFTNTDDYVSASLTISYTQSNGDDGLTSVDKSEDDLCCACLIVVKELLRKAKRQWTK